MTSRVVFIWAESREASEGEKQTVQEIASEAVAEISR